MLLLRPLLAAALVWGGPSGPEAPAYLGDEARERLEPTLLGALNATEAFGPLPSGPWVIRLHADDAGFDQDTGAPPQRAAAWIGATLHLRPWERLARRDLGALLRHELTHRRLAAQGLRRWREEAWCLWAETHSRPPAPRAEPDPATQDRLDRALAAGTTATQGWAYRWLRAWLKGEAPEPGPSPAVETPWEPEGEGAPGPDAMPPAPPPVPAAAREPEAAQRTVAVTWPPDRLPRTLVIQGEACPWRPGFRRTWQGGVRFGSGAPVTRLDGEVRLRAVSAGWSLTWILSAETWIAAATEGELGDAAPAEAKRALVAVLDRWLAGHPDGNHPDGSFCPLTHCAVVRGQPSAATLRAAASRPALELDPRWAFFTGSQGGVALSPRAVWGRGPAVAGTAQRVPGDRWADWKRSFSAAQVRALKAAVPPGVAPGQLGLRLGASGPYAVERLRLEAGRLFGWTAWPSDACSGRVDARGILHLAGHGWGHNAGLCLATAVYRARRGVRAEALLAQAFPAAGSE